MSGEQDWWSRSDLHGSRDKQSVQSEPLSRGLVGRSSECKALEEILASVRDSGSRVLVLRGDAGIGKSALLQYLIRSAAGFKVVQASGVESEMDLPFAGLHQLCGSFLDRLAGLPDPQRDAASAAFGLASGGPPERLLIGLACLNLLSSAADESPLLCVVDDAQWLDTASAQALAFVARRLLADRVALVFATRQPTTDLAPFPELAVERLRVADAETLLSSMLPVPLDKRVRDRIVAETQGNPLALIEWTRGLTPAELAGGFGMSTLLPLTSQIEESFRRRVAELPRRSQQFLTVAAAEPTGDAMTVWRAAATLGISRHDAAPALDAALLDIGIRVSFRHPLMRSAAYGSASSADRQKAHRALAQATDASLEPDRQAWHRALGSEGPDDEIADALEQSAGRARARGGFAAAAALLERSILLTSHPSGRCRRTLAAANAHLEAGSYEIATDLVASVETPHLDDRGRAQLELTQAHQASSLGDYRDVPAMFLRAAALMDAYDPELAGNSYLDALAAASIAGDFARGVSISDIARAAGQCPAASAKTMQGQLIAGLALATVEGPAAAMPTLRAVVDESTENTSLPDEFLRLVGYLTAAASVLWDCQALRRVAALQVTIWRDAGGLTMLPWALKTLAHVLTLEGDFDGAAATIAESNQIIEATGSVTLPWAGPAVAAWRGSDDSLQLIQDFAAAALKAGQAQTLSSAQWSSAILYNGLGQYEDALAVAMEAIKHPWEWGFQFHFHELIEAAFRCNETSIAAAALERLRTSVEASGSDWGLGVYNRSQALLAEGAEAERWYLAAIDRLARTPLRPELARAHLVYGEWLRTENRRAEARTQLRSAHQMFTGMGIEAFAERTRRELLASGEAVRRRSFEPRHELTSQEAAIARLAADGCTNPEIGAQLFISARTVEWHLRNVFSKLDITSRRELRRGLLRPFSLTADE